MKDDIGRDLTGSNPTLVESVKSLLDYAIEESTKLPLPVFVMARLERSKDDGKKFRDNSARRAARQSEERVAS